MMLCKPYCCRGPIARKTFIICIMIILITSFRKWTTGYNLDYNLDYIVESTHLESVPGSIRASLRTAASLLKSPQQPKDPEFPKKIWYKLGPRGLSEDMRKWTKSCISQNPEFSVEFLDDEAADAFVNTRFADRPDLLEVYNTLTVPILKVDLLRYLILYAEGGVWFYLDTSCEGIPIKDWIPTKFKPNANLVVGWEFDGGYSFDMERQFQTWTIMARKGVSHLMAAANDVVDSIQEIAKAHNSTVAETHANVTVNVIDFTVPRRFHKSVVKSLKQTPDVNWIEYWELLEPKMAGDVLILPGYLTAQSRDDYRKEDQHRIQPPLVVHHFSASWRNPYGGEVPPPGYSGHVEAFPYRGSNSISGRRRRNTTISP